MKLKKIASLALAGIMAVSMLAGCGDTDKKDPTPEQGGETVVAGFSATLADKLGDTVDKDYISVKDNAADVTALEKALNYISEPTLKDLAKKKTVTPLNGEADVASMIADFMDRAGFTLDDGLIGVKGLDMTYYAGNNGYDNRTVKDGTIYIVNGAVGEDEAVKLVAAEVKKVLKEEGALPEHNVAGQDKYDYEYVISASVATKALDSTFTGAANSVVFVAVTVTRTASAD